MNTQPLDTTTTALVGLSSVETDTQIKILSITPTLAERLLACNTHNRPLNESRVRRLAAEMEEGKWRFNGDAIRLSDGKLIDGQHRLEACKRSGIPMLSVVITGLDDAVFSTIDTGMRRSAGDTLAVVGEQNASRLAAALRFVERFTTGRMGKTIRLTNAEVQEVLTRHEGLRASVDKCAESPTKLVPLSVLAGLHYLFSAKDRELADKMFDQLVNGQGLEEGEPIYVLRERLVNNAASKGRLREDYIAALMIKAWNATRKGVKVKYIRYRDVGPTPESFPEIA